MIICSDLCLGVALHSRVQQLKVAHWLHLLFSLRRCQAPNEWLHWTSLTPCLCPYPSLHSCTMSRRYMPASCPTLLSPPGYWLCVVLWATAEFSCGSRCLISHPLPPCLPSGLALVRLLQSPWLLALHTCQEAASWEPPLRLTVTHQISCLRVFIRCLLFSETFLNKCLKIKTFPAFCLVLFLAGFLSVPLISSHLPI